MLQIATTPVFDKKIKHYKKRYLSFEKDLLDLASRLKKNPDLGVKYLGLAKKIRLAIKSKNKGKSGGVRVVFIVLIKKSKLFFLDILDKSDSDAFSKDNEKKLVVMMKKIRKASDKYLK